jgi:plasmid stabilization system protein ParE
MTIRYTATALAETDHILRYIANEDPATAVLVGVAIKRAIAKLRLFPRMGAETDEPDVYITFARPYRYLIFYKIYGKTLTIRNVRHPARQRPPAT